MSFGYDQIACLTALDAIVFAPCIAAIQAAADNLSTAGSSTGAAVGADVALLIFDAAGRYLSTRQ